jgi:hypothetical protein
MSDTIRFAGAAAVLQPATLRMEKALAEDVTPAVVKYFKRLMAESKQECSSDGRNSEALTDAFLERVTRVAKLNTDEIAKLVKYMMDELQTSPEAFEATLRPVFINRARIFAASRPAAQVNDDVEVVLPDLSLFVHKMFVTAANAVVNAQALFMAPSAHSKLSEYDRQRKRAQLVKTAVLRSLDIIQPPHTFGVKYFKQNKSKPDEPDKVSVRSSADRAPKESKEIRRGASGSGSVDKHGDSRHRRDDKRRLLHAKSHTSNASTHSSLKSMGFDEEEDEDEHKSDPDGILEEEENDLQEGGDGKDLEAESARDSAVGAGPKLRNHNGPPPKPRNGDELSVLSAQPYYRKRK